MTVKPNIHVWLVSGIRTPDRHHGFRYAEQELRLPLRRTVFIFLSQIYYINRCPHLLWALLFLPFIVEFPIYLFYLVSFNTEQTSFSMDINTRIVSIQQLVATETVDDFGVVCIDISWSTFSQNLLLF